MPRERVWGMNINPSQQAYDNFNLMCPDIMRSAAGGWQTSAPLRPDGYPLEIVEGGPIAAKAFGTGLVIPDGLMTIELEGTGIFQMRGGFGSFEEATLDNTPGGPTPGIKTREVPFYNSQYFGGSAQLEARIHKSVSGDPLRDIRVWLPGQRGKVIHDDFRRDHVGFKRIRWMDAFRINAEANDWVEWDDVQPATAQTFNELGRIPFDYAIDVTNEMGADLWLNCPCFASLTPETGFVWRLAQFVDSRLHPNAEILFEFGNEVWNPFFLQYYKLVARYNADTNPSKPTGIGEWEAIAYYDALTTNCFREAMAAINPSRKYRIVLARQSGYFQTLLTAIEYYDLVGGSFDIISNAPYLRSSDPFEVEGLNVAIALWESGDQAGAIKMVLDDLQAGGVDRETAEGILWNNKAAELSAKYGRTIEHICYEGGQSLVNQGSATATAIFIAANRSPQIKDVLARHFQSFPEGMDMTLFFDAGRPTLNGMWGHKEYTNQPYEEAYKWQAVREAMGDIVIPPPPPPPTGLGRPRSIPPRRHRRR